MATPTDAELKSFSEWYTRFYDAAPKSKAHAAYCERVYGLDLCQIGYVTVKQVHDLIAAGKLGPNHQVLDLGCGTGMITEYIAEQTGACLWGIDTMPEAIRQAQTRTAGKPITYEVADMSALDFPPATFDTIIALDALYFTDLDATIAGLKPLLSPGGQMLIYYNLILWNEADDRTTLLPHETPLGGALRHHVLVFTTQDYLREEYERSKLSKQVAESLKSAFADEGNLFLYENRIIEADGNIGFIDAGRMCRYLYHVTT